VEALVGAVYLDCGKDTATVKQVLEAINLPNPIANLLQRMGLIPACRKNRCTEKNNRYFDSKHLKICVQLNISYNFL
jgi:hypothetical protein